MQNRGRGGTPEKRANIRLHRVLAIQLEYKGEQQSAVAVDISVAGFQVATTFSIPVGEIVPMKVHLTNGPRVEGTAEVVWCEKMDLGLFRLGCQFDELRSKDDLERLCLYVDKERLNAEGATEESEATLELASQVTLRSLTSVELDRFAVLARISDLLNGCYRLDEVLDRALKITVEATGAERGMVLLDRGEPDFSVPAFHTVTDNSGLDYSRSVVERVQESGQALLSLDAQKDERLVRSSSLKVMGTRSVLCLPIGTTERSYGMIYLDSSIRSGAFTEIDLRLATVIAGLAASAIERTESFARLAQNEKLASMGTLMAGIIHELSNPLGSILGLGELLSHEVEDKELAQDLLEEAGRCQRLVKDLLRLSRKEPAEFAPLNLSEVVLSAVNAVRAECERYRVKLVYQPENGQAIPVFGNSDHLRQVVLNLLSNAIYAAGQRDDGWVDLRVRVNGRQAEMMVSDNGPGLPPGSRSRLFDPFFTTKSAEHGTGLGLSIVHRIVTEHRSVISAENRPSGGALFTVTFPLYLDSEDENDSGRVVC